MMPFLQHSMSILIPPIQVPSGVDAEPYYFTIQQDDTSSAVVIPEDVQLTDQDMAGEAETLEMEPDQEVPGPAENSDLVMDSLTDTGQLC